MSIAVFKGNASGTGTVTVETPNTNSDFTIALPNRAGTLMMNGPTFSAYLSGSNQSITSGVNTVATLNTEEWDVGGCFNNTGSTVTLNGLSVPAYAFCPNVPGYYQVSANLRYVSVGNFTAVVANFNLNGGIYYRWFELTNGSYSAGLSSSGSMLIYLNGTGDYVQLAGQITATNPQFDNAGSPYTSRMQAVLVRSA